MSLNKDDEHENDETLMSSDDNDDDEIIKILMYSNEYAETIDQNKNNIVKDLHDHLDKMLDKSKLFKEQIKSLKNPRKSRRVLFHQRF